MLKMQPDTNRPHTAQNILDQLQHRLRRARPGSVLILVVALLVLLALMGTAFINTSGSDRYSAAQNTFNTEIDLLLQGLSNITQGVVVDGLFSGNTFSQFSQVTAPQSGPAPDLAYSLSDYPANQQSSFLADRIPVPFNLTTGASSPASPISPTSPPGWRFVSMLPSVSTFESPYVASNGGVATYTQRAALLPTSITLSAATGGKRIYPALFNAATNTTFLAADADGDGIADAGLFRLPVGTLNGVTYFGAVRVVDNLAAVNPAIAASYNNGDPPGTLYGNFYPTNIDFNSLVNPADSSNFALGVAFSKAKFAGLPLPSLTPVDDRPSTPPAPPAPPPAPVKRNDFSFGNVDEAFWMQVGRRIDSPGYNYDGANPQPYIAVPNSETQVMAHRFIIRDASVATSSASPSLLERCFPASVFSTPNRVAAPYTPDQSLQWGTDNFDFSNAAGNPMPLRSILVTRNPRSCFGPGQKLNAKGTFSASASPAQTYNFGDWVLNPADSRVYVCLQQTTTAPALNNPAWEQQPWVSSPLKASVNTASFGQLWLAYFSAMSDLPAPGGFNPGNKAASNMFRSSIRTVVTPKWTNVQQLQLRAAIAAINTLQIRSATPQNILSRDIVIADSSGAPTFHVTVYGSIPQPYITEVYANNNIGGSAYMAIELYNPYPFPISLQNWTLAAVSRPTGATSLSVTPFASTTTTWSVAATAPTVPQNGYIVLASSDPAPTPFDVPPGAPTASASAQPQTLFVVPELAMSDPAKSGFDHEVMLLAPAGASGAAMPIDSYDFTGLPPAEGPPGHEWHYIRPNDVNRQKAWHFVYPGYTPNANNSAAFTPTSTTPRQAGTQVDQVPTNQVTSINTLGAPDADVVSAPYVGASPFYPYIDRPLQVNNTDFGSPKSIVHYAFGGFLRHTDMLQVTYVGAYRITDAAGNLLEYSPVTMDSSQADEAALSQDTNAIASEKTGRENVGRFCPVHWADSVTATGNPVQTSQAAADGASLPDDFSAAVYTPASSGPPPTSPTLSPNPLWTSYHWTLRIFDYVTVQAPFDDYLPDQPDPSNNPTETAVANRNYLVANARSDNNPVTATEEAIPVHGLININTACWRVLATVNFVDPNTGLAVYKAANNQIAQSIVYYRDVDDGTGRPHGPFQSILELNNVAISPQVPGPIASGTLIRTAFSQHLGNFVVSGQHGSNYDGDLSPLYPHDPAAAAQDRVYGDFENQNLMLSNISNLITTRSDSFTAYIIVQGWQGAGTNHPQLVAQRRAAFIIDRSGITPLNKSPAVTNVPVN